MQAACPIDASRLERLLYDYDSVLKDELIRGFTSGFDVGFRGSVLSNTDVTNMSSCFDYPQVVSDYLKTEVEEGRMCGPFSSLPFCSFQLNKIGVVEKRTPGKFRIICDLSSPKGNSINDGIDDSFAKVTYASLADAIHLITMCGPHPYMSKLDIKAAFRLLPIKKDQHHLFCVKWKGMYYYDKFLAMGCRSACRLFEKFSTALEHIARRKIKHMCHYLDDYFMVNPTNIGGHGDVKHFESVCKYTGTPLEHTKTVWPTQCLEYTGLELDTRTEEVRLPPDKLYTCKQLVHHLLTHRTCTLKVLQQALGHLSHACTAIIPGRAFLRRLYYLTVGVAKPYHFVTITKEYHEDLVIWGRFLDDYNGVSLYREAMFIGSGTHHIYSDAAQSLGCGAFFDGHWFSIPWPSEWWKHQNITLLELTPIVLAVESWCRYLKNSYVILHTDNEALHYCINKQTSKEPLVMSLIRRLVIAGLQSNIQIRAEFVPGTSNSLADALSRLQVQRFQQLCPGSDAKPEKVVPLPASMS